MKKENGLFHAEKQSLPLISLIWGALPYARGNRPSFSEMKREQKCTVVVLQTLTGNTVGYHELLSLSNWKDHSEPEQLSSSCCFTEQISSTKDVSNHIFKLSSVVCGIDWNEKNSSSFCIRAFGKCKSEYVKTFLGEGWLKLKQCEHHLWVSNYLTLPWKVHTKCVITAVFFSPPSPRSVFWLD